MITEKLAEILPVTIRDLKSFLPEECVDGYDKMTDLGNTNKREIKAYASVFRLLSYDAFVDAIIPLCICDDTLIFQETCATSQCTSTILTDFAEKLSCFSSEFSRLLLCAANDYAPLNAVLKLLRYCVELVTKCHRSDILPEIPSPIQGTYNPPKLGTAYYFSDYGYQIRQIQKFTADSKKGSENFDDLPDFLCAKRFPQVSKQGTPYIFLWFCPQYGYCFGYHIIPGSERRKDPASSLYSHLECPPDIVSYDFACSLSEYTHNRESGYLQNTHFYHDVFHGFTHKCTPAFRCDKLKAFKTVNSSICEQFNSFIQSMKTSSKLMPQCHFSFYLQFS